MQCFLITQDLMFSSQATVAAKAADLDVQTVRSAEQIHCDGQHIVVLDLTIPSLNISDTVVALKQKADTKIIAVGPHVHEAKLNAATNEGCDIVLTKGQASRQLEVVLGKLANDS